MTPVLRAIIGFDLLASFAVAACKFGLVTGARIVYDAVCWLEWQPWRSLVFEVGNFTHAGMIVLLLINLHG